MALAVQSLGHNETTGTGTSLALTALQNIAAGDLVTVAVSHGNNTTAFTSVVDGTNTYTRLTSGALSGGNGVIELWRCANCAAVTSPTLTVNGPSAVDYTIAALRCSGANVSPVDTHPAAVQATTASPTVSTGTLSQADELVVGCLQANNGPTITTAPGFTDIQKVTLSDNNKALNMAYQIVASTATVAYSPTLSGSQTTAIIVASFTAVVAADTLSAQSVM